MSEYRYDIVQGYWVIIAPNRNGRPNEFMEMQWRRAAESCPFCADHEHQTPPEIARYCLPGQETWQVRVVPNKYPAVYAHEFWAGSGTDPTQPLPGYGAHEVIIESPEHLLRLTQLDVPAVHLVLKVYQDRLRSLRQRGDMAYGIVFKNLGADAGASLEHLHSQVLATALLPPPIAERLARWQHVHRTTGQTAVLRWLEEEQQVGTRVVEVTDHFAVVCPFASRLPFEVRIVPRLPQPYFESVRSEQLWELASVFHRTLRRVEHAAGLPPYNVIMHTAPFDSPPHDYFHWYLEVLPRLTRTAGFEWGTGCFINPMEPECAAELLRLGGETTACSE